jgi:hypothetical protein
MTKEVAVKKDKTDDQWQKYLNTSWNNMAKHAMEFAKRMHDFRESRESHGDFVEQAIEWFGVTKDGASDWSLIGAQYSNLVKDGRVLPASRTALKKLSLLSSKDIDVLEAREMFTPKLSGAMVDEFVAEMKVLETSDPKPQPLPVPVEEPIEGDFEEVPTEKIPEKVKETKQAIKPEKKVPSYSVDDAYEVLNGVPYTREILIVLKKHAISEASQIEDEKQEDIQMELIDKAVAKIIECQFD